MGPTVVNRTNNGLFLEDFDIKGLHKMNPQLRIGVNKSVIYCQIAKLSNNPNRKKEMVILCKAIDHTRTTSYRGARYTILTCDEIMKCFMNQLDGLPKTTFVEWERIETI